MANKRFEKYYSFHLKRLKNILRSRFKWSGLPDTIDERALNDMVLFEGYAVGYKYKDKIIVTTGALSGIGTYLGPTTFTSANIHVVPQQERTIGKDCAVCYNTDNYIVAEPFTDLVDIYAARLADLDISVNTSIKNSRVSMIPVVDDDKEAIRTAKVLEQIYDGEPSVLSYKTAFTDKGVDVYPIRAKDNIVTSELADARRNIMADFYAAIGVDTIAVDKKERTNLMEMNSNNGQLLLDRDAILRPRQRWCEDMNKLFNLNISVELNDPKEVESYAGIGETYNNNAAES